MQCRKAIQFSDRQGLNTRTQLCRRESDKLMPQQEPSSSSGDCSDKDEQQGAWQWVKACHMWRPYAVWWVCSSQHFRASVPSPSGQKLTMKAVQPSTLQELHTQWHSTTSRSTQICSNTAVRTKNLATQTRVSHCHFQVPPLPLEAPDAACNSTALDLFKSHFINFLHIHRCMYCAPQHDSPTLHLTVNNI